MTITEIFGPGYSMKPTTPFPPSSATLSRTTLSANAASAEEAQELAELGGIRADFSSELPMTSEQEELFRSDSIAVSSLDGSAPGSGAWSISMLRSTASHPASDGADSLSVRSYRVESLTFLGPRPHAEPDLCKQRHHWEAILAVHQERDALADASPAAPSRRSSPL